MDERGGGSSVAGKREPSVPAHPQHKHKRRRKPTSEAEAQLADLSTQTQPQKQKQQQQPQQQQPQQQQPQQQGHGQPARQAAVPVKDAGDAATAVPLGQLKEKEKKGKNKKLLSQERLRRLTEAADRRGVVYVSRLPPHMKPAKLRQLLSQYGEIGRVYCAPEAPSSRAARQRTGGSRSGKSFSEGWVEFEDKTVAKSVALALNGQQMGGRRRSAYHYDLWNLKYLSKFKWDHLTEEVAYERAVREQRMATELAAAKRERDAYLAAVDAAKAADAMAARRAARAADGGSGAASAGAAAAAQVESGSAPLVAAAAAAAAGAAGGVAIKRVYGQRRAKPAPEAPGAAQLGDDLLSLLVAPAPNSRQ